jgi:hypothetical protein
MDMRELVRGGKAAIPCNLIALDAQNQLFLVLLHGMGTSHPGNAATTVNSMSNVAPPNWSKLWMHIMLKTDWESTLPESYQAPLAAITTIPGSAASSMSLQISGLTGTTALASS